MNEITVNTSKSANHLITNGKSSSVPTFFLHGFLGTSSTWNEILYRADFYAIAPDIVGHGKSSFHDLSLDYTADDWCEDLSEILDFLKIEKVFPFLFS